MKKVKVSIQDEFTLVLQEDAAKGDLIQTSLFDDSRFDTRALTIAADKVNDRYGEFTLVPATMANMQDTILKRVAFGSVQYL